MRQIVPFRAARVSKRYRFAICLFLGALAFGQPPGAAPRLRVGPVYTTEFPNLDVVVEAGAGGTAAASGNAASINAADLVLTEEGVRTSTALGLRKFSDSGQGVAVLLALDASGSMRGKPLDAVRKGLGQFVSKARDNDKIAVLSFADDVRWEAPWSGTREETRRKLEAIQARGRNTVLWDAIDTALDDLAKLDGPARRHLVVISDGHDEGSKKSLAEVIAKAVSLRIPVDAIGMTRSDPRYLENLKALSDQSKGSYTTAPDLDLLTQLVGNAITRMLDTPVARFRVEKLKADGSAHRVGVYWRAADLQDEMSVEMPSSTQQQLPHNQPTEPGAKQGMNRWWYAAIAGGAAILIIAAWLIFRPRRYTGGLPPPERMPLEMPWTPPPPIVFDSPAPRLPDSANPGLPSNPVPAPPIPAPGFRLPASSPEKPRARTQYAAGFRPPALLIGKSGPFAGKTFRIESSDFWVGAAENNNLQLDDETVSGNHAFFRFEAESLKIFDNHSTNDTWVNRQAVGGAARVLFPGDEIQIGRSVFVVESPKNVAQPGSPFTLS